MKECLSDKYFMDANVMQNSLKHLTKYFSKFIQDLQIEMMELYMVFIYIFSALGLMNYLFKNLKIYF